MIIVVSRPMRSETQPQKIRLAPLASGLSVAASVSAAALSPHDRAIGPALAVTSSPPVAMSTNIDVHHVELRRAQHLTRGEVPTAELRPRRRPRAWPRSRAPRADASGTARR